MEDRLARAAAIHPIEHQAMQMDVDIGGGAEALDERDRTGVGRGMWQAANLKDLELPILIPGIRINTGPNDYSPIEQMQLQRFDGKQWVLFGDIIAP